MPKRQNLTAMSVDELLDLREQVSKLLAQKADQLQQQISRLNGSETGGGRRAGRKPAAERGHALKGRKVPAKYRSKADPKLTWSGRGAVPRWMRDEMKSAKLKKEDFAI
jgi:DNA-binding protein H-NS